MKKTTLTKLGNKVLTNSADYSYIGVYENIRKEYPKKAITNMTEFLSADMPLVIARHSLKALESKGNIYARDILFGINNGIVTIDDLAQEVALSAIELDTQGLLFTDSGIDFDNSIVCKSLFGAVSAFMYKQQTKHYRKMYFSIDDIVCAYDDIQKLSSVADIDGILASDYIVRFMELLTDTEREFLKARLQGLSVVKTAIHLSITRDKTRTIEKHVRAKWLEYNR